MNRLLTLPLDPAKITVKKGRGLEVCSSYDGLNDTTGGRYCDRYEHIESLDVSLVSPKGTTLALISEDLSDNKEHSSFGFAAEEVTQRDSEGNPTETVCKVSTEISYASYPYDGTSDMVLINPKEGVIVDLNRNFDRIVPGTAGLTPRKVLDGAILP